MHSIIFGLQITTLMNQVVSELEPRAVWQNFTALNAVPRPSKKEERVIQFMMNFGKELGLETLQDEVGNVIIRKPASPGMEDRKTVVLQSHLDMVHQKNTATQFDFDSEGIRMFRDGAWVKAEGTTLGADNGMGVAAIMAILQSDTVVHPPIEALFTIDEETGMTGAKGLQPGVLNGSILLNLDTEDDDEIDIGCAGGIDITGRSAYQEEKTYPSHKAFRLDVKGLKGGHSGMDIHLGLGNANKIMNRLLYHLSNQCQIRIASIDGGGLRNAIPRESTALILVSEEESAEVVEQTQQLAHTIREELRHTEPDLLIKIDKTERPGLMMNKTDQMRLLRTVYALHNGVYAMSASIPDLVETSNNIARVRVQQGEILINCLTRSSVDTAKMDLAYALKSAMELGGCEVELSGSYPGWTPNPDSEILEILKERYEALFGASPRVVACHAGLECGILGQHYPEMDMISFGPTIKGAHSPDERVKIESVQKFWKYLQDILLHIPKAQATHSIVS